MNEVVQGEFKCAGKDLPVKVNGNEFALNVRVRFITGHAATSL